MSSVNRDRDCLTFPLQRKGWFYFSYLIALVGVSSTMLKKSSEIEHPCLFTTLKEKLSGFTIENDISYGFFINTPYYIEEIPFYP